VWLLGSLAGPAHAQVGSALTSAEVNRIVAQAAAEAERIGLRAHIAVTDQFGNPLAVFRMTGAPCGTRVVGTVGQGLEGAVVATELAAISKAGPSAGTVRRSRRAAHLQERRDRRRDRRRG
jgi:uncharacterized protein GlcG (DUF336 family)